MVKTDRENERILAAQAQDIYLPLATVHRDAILRIPKTGGEKMGEDIKIKILCLRGLPWLPKAILVYMYHITAGGTLNLPNTFDRVRVDLGLNPTSVSRAMNKLEQAGYISRLRQGRRIRGYSLNLENLGEL